MHYKINISGSCLCTFNSAGNGVFSLCENADNQRHYNRTKTAAFTGKERDSETGFSYFGARYYDSYLSGLFLSVDPMSDKYPSLSPYVYCAWNPMNLIDPNGTEIEDPPTTWTTINAVINKTNVVVWGDLNSKNCFLYAKVQVEISGYEVFGMFCKDLYDEVGNSANRANVEKSVNYINNQLEKGMPVMVGVDCKPGYEKENGDKTTDHYIVIVGRGSDDKGNYFQFYDNASIYRNAAANPENKLYYFEDAAIIRGLPCRSVGYAYRQDHQNREYTITQVWATRRKREDESLLNK